METNKENKKKLVLKKIFLLKAIMIIGISRIIELITLSNGEKKFINSAKNERIIIEYMSDFEKSSKLCDLFRFDLLHRRPMGVNNVDAIILKKTILIIHK